VERERERPTRGRAEAIDALLEHREFVHALASRCSFSRSGADDLEQETWLAALERPPASPVASPRGWLARVVRSLAVTDFRQERRRLARETRAWRIDTEPSASERFDRDRTSERLLVALMQLTPLERKVIELHDDAGVSTREIGRRLELTRRQVHELLERAHLRLRHRVEAE